ncbi:beta-lactamase family protein [Laceyella sacchari]|uniref:Beta-lactamase family protein n=1 Tax=Laceyella sacchari TaxID=37482 RepID=A0ABY5TYQ2_LACSH|nr:beta-lactamase family protein [Laceyella sacchari]
MAYVWKGNEGEVLICQGYGLANVENNVPNTPQTKYRIGSITKRVYSNCYFAIARTGSSFRTGYYRSLPSWLPQW